MRRDLGQPSFDRLPPSLLENAGTARVSGPPPPAAASVKAMLERLKGRRVFVTEQPDGRYRVRVEAADTASAPTECVTGYPLALIEALSEVKSDAYICDEILRDEDPHYVELFLRYGLLGYLPAAAFGSSRILDFGSGCGASTVALARMFPDAEIVGVELMADLIRVAELRTEHYALSNATFIHSPDPQRLPLALGKFDFINLGAVYEHLLPNERPRLLGELWSILKTRGVIFVNQLPYRFYPIEQHTTGLPFINYLPDRMAAWAARRFSARVDRDAPWPGLLRDGIRGGTAGSVRRDLVRDGGEARLLTPTQMGLSDHAGLWFGYSSTASPHPAKRVMRRIFGAAELLGTGPIGPGLSLAYEKRP